MVIEIYRNHGVLAHEKTNVFTYGGEHPHAVCSEVIMVEIPENWGTAENEYGELLLVSPWGWNYLVNDVLAGDATPLFRARDKDGFYYTCPLKVVD